MTKSKSMAFETSKSQRHTRALQAPGSGFPLEKDSVVTERLAWSSHSELVFDKLEESGSVMVPIVYLLEVLQERK